MTSGELPAALILTITRSNAVSPMRSRRARWSWYKKLFTPSQSGAGSGVEMVGVENDEQLTSNNAATPNNRTRTRE